MLRSLVLILVLGAGLSQEVLGGVDSGPTSGLEEVQWRRDVLESIQRLVQVQTQVLKLLSTLGNEVSLLVENHQALLLQTSRIATNLQEVTRKSPPPPPEVSIKSRDVQ
ncbi:hypothetical protein NQD34_010103 [Periophthalmus magnuspinnatus]|nr:hypothetical protein NQD34_010103 [Periophthalmus magnuspinnatus]